MSSTYRLRQFFYSIFSARFIELQRHGVVPAKSDTSKRA
jgi:hypothetical protein